MAKNINVGLEISAIDKASAPLARISANLSSLGKSVQSVSRLGVALGAVGAATVALGAAMGARMGINFTKGIIETSAQFESFEIQLKSLTGSSENARKALAWAEDFAKKTPLELTDVIESYAQLKNFGLDPTTAAVKGGIPVMQALVDTMAKSGKGAEHLSGIVLAVGQAWSKEKLQGEEALQLIERGVPVWSLLSKATGKTTVQLQKLSEKGKLGRKEIALLINEMGKSATGASEDFSKAWAGMLSNMADTWTSIKRMIGEAGVFEFAKTRLKSILDMLNNLSDSGQLKKITEAIGKFLTSAMVAAEGAAMRFWNVIKQWADPMGTAKDSADVVTLALEKLQETVSSAFSAIGSFVDAVGGWGNVFIAFGVIITASVLAPLAALLVALGPVGAAVAAFASLAAVLLAKWTIAADGLKGVWAEITGEWDKFTTSIGDVGRALGIMSGPIQQPIGATAVQSAAKAAAPAANKSTVDLNVMLKSEDGSLARVGNVKTKGKGVNLSVDNGPSMAGFGSGF